MIGQKHSLTITVIQHYPTVLLSELSDIHSTALDERPNGYFFGRPPELHKFQYQTT